MDVFISTDRHRLEFSLVSQSVLYEGGQQQRLFWSFVAALCRKNGRWFSFCVAQWMLSEGFGCCPPFEWGKAQPYPDHVTKWLLFIFVRRNGREKHIGIPFRRHLEDEILLLIRAMNRSWPLIRTINKLVSRMTGRQEKDQIRHKNVIISERRNEMKQRIDLVA